MHAANPRAIAPVAAMLLLGASLTAVGQTIDVIPTMPPAAVCADPAIGARPSSEATGPADVFPSTHPEAVVGVIPPSRTTTPAELPLWRGSWEGGGSVAIAPRTGAMVATLSGGPFHTILWGGTGADGRLLNDGVMIDDSGATRVLPAAPVCPRRDFAWSVGTPGVMIGAAPIRPANRSMTVRGTRPTTGHGASCLRRRCRRGPRSRQGT